MSHHELYKNKEKMGPGPIYCCYVLKLRMSSFLQNGAWPHFFLNIATSYRGNGDAYQSFEIVVIRT